jgi:hypothetical protein
MTNIEGAKPSDESTTTDRKSSRRRLKNSNDLAKQIIERDLFSETPKVEQSSSRFSEWLKSKKIGEDSLETKLDEEDKDPDLEDKESNNTDDLSDQERAVIAAYAQEQNERTIDDEPETVRRVIEALYNKVIKEGQQPEAAEEDVVDDFSLSDTSEAVYAEPGRAEAEADPTPRLDEVIWFDRTREAELTDEDISTRPAPIYESPASELPVPVPTPTRRTGAPETRKPQPASPDALFSGIAGYLIGRRRERAKDKAKIDNIEETLEKKVEDFGQRLNRSEANLKRLASQENTAPIIPTNTERPVKTKAEQPKKPKTFESYLDKALPKPEASLTEKPAKASERLAKAIVPAETIVASQVHERLDVIKEDAKKDKAKPEIRTETRVEKVEISPDKIDKLNRKELLEVSKKIIIEGESLKQIYDRHLIGEKGLRRLVREYLRGKDIRKAVKREMVERQIDFERDPILRDRPHDNSSSSNSSSSTPDQVLDGLITQAAAKLSNAKPQSTFTQPQQQSSQSKSNGSGKVSPLSDMIIYGIITVLILAILIVYVSHHS